MWRSIRGTRVRFERSHSERWCGRWSLAELPRELVRIGGRELAGAALADVRGGLRVARRLRGDERNHNGELVERSTLGDHDENAVRKELFLAPLRGGYIHLRLLLFKKAFFDGLVSGAVTLTFRRWQKPHVKTGGRYRCHPIGVLQVDEVAVVPLRSITSDDANRAGFLSLDALVAYLTELGPLDEDTTVFRVRLHHGGDGDRVAGALDETLSDDDREALRAKLARLDSPEPWTRKTLALIERHPRIAASKLAAKLGRDTAPFKADVVKLKKLGLTQSFEVGYEIAPRGRAYLAASRKKRTRGAR